MLRFIVICAGLALAACAPPAEDNGSEHVPIDANSTKSLAPDALDNQIAEVAAEGENATAQPAVAGDECLSPWDGSSREMVEKVKTVLRDPDSFEHISTAAGPIEPSGKRFLVMRFRSRNGLGGMNVEELPATLDTHDCHITMVSSMNEVSRALGQK